MTNCCLGNVPICVQIKLLQIRLCLKVTSLGYKSAVKNNNIRLASFILDIGHGFSESYCTPVPIEIYWEQGFNDSLKGYDPYLK